MNSYADWLWGKKAKPVYLLIACSILLLTLLGSRDIWTQEYRWADIVAGMFFRNDFLHPYLHDVNYYDKPLLSYWFIAFTTWITGQLSTWALRLPSALAGVLAVWSIYRLGVNLKDKRLGLLAGWILMTCFYFIFWARTSSADMLNVAGSLFAVCWYFEKKNQPSLFNYAIFFLILALTSLCKGLVGAIVPLLVIFPDMLMKGEWKKHLNFSIVLATIPAAIVYVLPFWASAHFGGDTYEQSGLYLVYRENFLRYFQPFDHKDPIYSYLIYLPVYLFPWAFFFVPALFSLKSRWKNLSPQSKWMVWSVVLLFLFFTFSGSRRNYYVLPMVPFAVLMTADWILANTNELAKRGVWAGRMAVVSFLVFFLIFDVIQPAYYSQGGYTAFTKELKGRVEKVKPWADWKIVMLDPESKIRFYLQLSPQVKNYAMTGDSRTKLHTEESLLKEWPMLKNKDDRIIFISRKLYEPALRNLLPGYEVVKVSPNLGERVMRIDDKYGPVAFVPL